MVLLVLLGALPAVQQDGCDPPPHLPRAGELRVFNYQPPLAAVRRLAYEAADAGLLSPDLAAGIQGVKGAKKFSIRIGN